MSDVFSNRTINMSINNTKERNHIKLDVIKPLYRSDLDSLLDCLGELSKKVDLMVSVSIKLVD